MVHEAAPTNSENKLNQRQLPIKFNESSNYAYSYSYCDIPWRSFTELFGGFHDKLRLHLTGQKKEEVRNRKLRKEEKLFYTCDFCETESTNEVGYYQRV